MYEPMWKFDDPRLLHLQIACQVMPSAIEMLHQDGITLTPYHICNASLVLAEVLVERVSKMKRVEKD